MKNVFLTVFIILFIGLGFDFVQQLLKNNTVYKFYYGYLFIYALISWIRWSNRQPNIHILTDQDIEELKHSKP